ncbi:MAG: bifunctional adenosylcobinamide kinase/adenosylcobinamide-phosphate guanylyltransferase [Candidatus Omnitrophota bacterium]
MGKITLILGGARSGKSRFALKLAQKSASSLLFIATAAPSDNEMRKRIKLHRKNRPSRWKTIEEPVKLSFLVKRISKKTDLIIIDCMTIFISNLLLKGRSDYSIQSEVNSVLRTIRNSNFNTLIVSNEVGMGIVPDNPLARRFRDLAGKINQSIAAASDEVYLIVSGLPLKLKGADNE